MKRVIAIVLAALMVVAVGSGCKAKSAGSKPIIACVGSEPKSIDPAINQAVDGSTYIVHMFEGLCKMDKNQQIVAGVAKNWDVSSDGLTYTFHLRKDATWSDGKTVTAGDFVYAWQRLANPKTASAYSYQLYYVKNAQEINSQALGTDGKPEKVKFGADGQPVTDAKGNYVADPNGKYISAKADGSAVWLDDLGVKATDDQTLVVTLAAPCSYFTQIAAFPSLYPIRKDVVEKNPDTWTQNPATCIGNGPYKLKSWTHNSKIVMVKNDKYYDAKDVVSNEIDWMLMDDATSILAAYKNHQLYLADSVPTDEIAALTKSGDCKVYGNLGTYYYVFNTKKAPFDNEKVREALTLAIDREYLVKNVAKGGQEAAGAFVPTGIPDATKGSDFRKTGKNYFDPSSAAYAKNVAKAKQLLSDAGYPDGKGLPTIELKYNTDEGHQKIAEYIQSEWKKNLGLNVTIVNEEWAVFQTDRTNGNYMVARDGWLGDYVDPMTFLDLFTSTSGNNDAKWANSQFDSLIKQAKSSADQTTRMTDMHNAENILMSGYAAMPIYYYTDPDLVSPQLKGYVHSALGYKYLMWASINK